MPRKLLINPAWSLIWFYSTVGTGIVITWKFQESFLSQSVSQLINLLWSTRPEMTPSQCVLFHRHVSVLKTLLTNLPFPRTFIRQSFAEEFQ
jgi:hypothetical protein